jgi:hypothetical protein
MGTFGFDILQALVNDIAPAAKVCVPFVQQQQQQQHCKKHVLTGAGVIHVIAPCTSYSVCSACYAYQPLAFTSACLCFTNSCPFLQAIAFQCLHALLLQVVAISRCCWLFTCYAPACVAA